MILSIVRPGSVGRRPAFRSLAAKFSGFTATLVFWVAGVFLAYDVRRGSLGFWKGLVVCTAVVLVSGAISRFTIRLLVKPIEMLLDGVDGVRQGRLEPILVSPTNDEVECLGHRFNGMIAALAESRRETIEQQELLEQRIQQRTQELQDAMQRAIAANAAKGDFLAHMSHELRTPMNGVLGMLDMVLDTRLTQEQREHLMVSQRCAYSLLALLNNVLDLSKIESGRMELEMVPFDLHLIVDDSVKTFQAAASQQGVALTCEYGAGVPRHVSGDPLRLRQILNNLLSNAVKFTQQGSVRLQLDVLAEDALSVHLRLVVEDTGIGIPADHFEQIFEEFSQGDSSTSRRYGGTGLGLTITRKLVEAFGGVMRVESEVGQGSAFIVELVLARDHAAKALDSYHHTAHRRSSVHCLLVVEDNPVNQKVVTTVLRKAGYSILTAADGHEALTVLNRHEVDLVLMDVQMPVMDGLEATRRIRQQPHLRYLPVIAMTAHAMSGDRERCLAAGMNEYVSKPVQPAHLLSFIEQYLEEHAPPVLRSLHAKCGD